MITNWSKWHDAYARPDSGLRDRLAEVRDPIGRHLDATAPDPVRVVSACAGDGRDVLAWSAVATPTGSVPCWSSTTPGWLPVRARPPTRCPRRSRSGRPTPPRATSTPTQCQQTLCCSAASSATSAMPTCARPSRRHPSYAPRGLRWCGPVTATTRTSRPPSGAGSQTRASRRSPSSRRRGSTGQWASTGSSPQPRPLQPGRHWFTFFR